MEQLFGGITLELSQGAFPLSTDSVALADFIKLPRNAQVLDLGSGCGTLGLMLCGKDAGCHITGIELDPEAHRMALHNRQQNHLEDRFQSICADITAIPSQMDPGTFQVCISNPPYFTAGPSSRTVPLARREDSCSLQALIHSAAWSLRYGGDFFLVHRPERLAQICALASAEKLEPKRLKLLRHRTDGPVSLILLQCRKGGKPGLIWEESSLYDTLGQPTPYYHSLYHL